MEQAGPANALAAGMRALPGLEEAFASTQAAWRFYRNARLSLPDLAHPLHQQADQAIQRFCQQWALVLHDWSNLHYNSHPSKADRIRLTSRHDWGYRLLTQTLLDDQQGWPRSVLALSLRCARGVWSTRWKGCRRRGMHLDDLLEIMDQLRQRWPQRAMVHILDAEADSVGHYRQWDQRGHAFLVRADADRLVDWQGREWSLQEIAQQLWTQGAFTRGDTIRCPKGLFQQWVAQTTVVLQRPAYPQRVIEGRKRHWVEAGEPLELRLVLGRVREEVQGLQEQWLLLTNLPAEVDAATVVRWYGWRWRTETYYKLLKSAGQQVESWQQQSGQAVARRLAVASMACVVVWGLAHGSQQELTPLRKLLVRLSGRQMKRGRGRPGFTEPALLAGLWVLLAMLEVLEHQDLSQLKRWAAVLPFPRLRKHSDDSEGFV